MIIRKINRLDPALRIAAAIKVPDSDTGKQNYNSATGEYYPDRGIYPLVLTPVISYTEVESGEYVENAAADLIEGEWRRFDGTTDGGTEITNDTPLATAPGGKLCEIVTTAGSADYGKIKIYENVSAGNPVTYRFQGVLTAGGTRRVVSASYMATTQNETVMPRLMFDNTSQGVFNPWDDTSVFRITPSIVPSGYMPAATFRWEADHGKGWATVGSTVLDWAMKVDATDNSLVIERSVMQEEVSLRCVAEVSVDGSTVQVSRIVTHRRMLPAFQTDITHLAAISKNASAISPRALVSTNKGTPANLENEVEISWYGKDSAKIATGVNPDIKLSTLGEDMELGLDVKDRGGWKALADNDGIILTDSDGKIIITR